MKMIRAAIRTVFARRSSWVTAIVAGLIVLGLYFLLIARVTTLSMMFSMGGVAYTSFALVMLAFIATLFGINVAFFWYKRGAQLALGIKEGIGSTVGTVLGGFAAGCPVCGAFLLSLIGVTSGLAIFPLKGIEVQLASAAALMLSLHWSSKSIIACKNCEVRR